MHLSEFLSNRMHFYWSDSKDQRTVDETMDELREWLTQNRAPGEATYLDLSVSAVFAPQYYAALHVILRARRRRVWRSLHIYFQAKGSEGYGFHVLKATGSGKNKSAEHPSLKREELASVPPQDGQRVTLQGGGCAGRICMYRGCVIGREDARLTSSQERATSAEEKLLA
jgi:hypothetical protein